jgi:NADH dehydrogenase
VLIEAANKVLGNFRLELSEYSLRALRDLGVEVILGEPVEAIDADGLVYGGKRLDAECIIWAAGVQASPAAKWLDVEPDKAGRVKVAPDLSVPTHPEIFVVGDTATIAKADGKPVPGVGDAAKQGGKHAAQVIRARLRGDTTPLPFRYKHAGDLATIGKRAAVIDFGWIRLKGWLAWWVWGIAHIYFLIDTKNRLAVALSWLWIYLSGQRSARLITQGDAETRPPINDVTES